VDNNDFGNCISIIAASGFFGQLTLRLAMKKIKGLTKI